jgi:drug/metabolite transporter (DMT)-like permease
MAALAVAVLAISTSAILVRWSEAPSLVKALYRVVFTTLLLAPLAFTRHGAELRSLARGDLLVACASGVALAVHFASWFESLRWTSVAASVTLVQSQPVFVAVGAAVLLDERVGRTRAVGIAVALAGMVVMSGGELLAGGAAAGRRPLYGDGLAVLGAVMVAAYYLAGRALRQRVSLVPYVVVVYAVCAVALLAFTLAGPLLSGGPTDLAPLLFDYPAREWLLFLAMAVGPGIFGHTVINWSLAHLDSSVVSVSLLGEPLGSTLLAVYFFAEVPGVATVVGGAVVLAGIYLTTREGEPASGTEAGRPVDDATTVDAEPGSHD